ncbi:Hsp70 family protein [Micromonospora sp. NBC_00898]|uniref:Hsp70 family protein n=1 Tax=Micromonospora sp. NBC_00898 TaxID=2975981 RepID=UPI0038676924|nr:Hsp70 family protein [Micromonospora sp. NBC_00898]
MAGQQDGFALGVDLGTSNTVAVLRWPDGRTRPLLVDGQPILPSGVYADADGQLHVGRDAQRLAQVDPDRYEPNPKRRVDEAAVPLGDRRLSPAELLAAVLFTVAETAVGAVGFLPPAVVTCPATWDADRRQVLADALALAGWPSAAEHTMSGPTPPGTRLLREPVAAARYYTEVLHRPVPVGDAVAVFDFGGGTLDVAVVRNEGADPWGDSGFTVVSCGGLDDLGGLDLDAALVEMLGARIAAAHPAEWARLIAPENTTQWRDRLRFLENVRGAKEMLSRNTLAPVAVPGVEAAVPLTRAELEGVATPLLRRAIEETRRVVTTAGLTPERLAGLFLVGGSSRIPLVARMLHAELGVAPTVLEQPELPVAEGALTDLPLRRTGPAPRPLIPAPAGPRPGPGPAATLPDDGGPTPRLAAGPVGPADPPRNDGAPALQAMAGHGVGPGAVRDPFAGRPTATAGHGPGPAGTAAGLPYPGRGADAAGLAVPPVATAAPAGHWVGVPQGVPGVPPSAATGPGGRRRRTLWISLGAVVALAAVTTAAVLYVTRDRHPELEFQAFGTGTRIPAGTDRPTEMFTAALGDRAYLAYRRDDDRLEVVAADAGTGRELWRKQSAAPAERWDRIVALPGAVALLADGSGTSTPGELEVLDAGSGRQRWHRAVHGDDEFFFGTDVLVLADRDGHRLVGLRMGDGSQKWSRADPTDQYGNSRTSVHPVTSEEGLSGPGFADGRPRDPWQGDVARIVQVSADRSVRLIDMASGMVVRRRTNVAEPDDLVAAHSDRLYVAGDDGRLLSYDLGSLAEPTVLYTAQDDRHRPRDLVPCGEHRACLLEVTDADQTTVAVVAAAEGRKAERWSAPGADLLVPFGDRVLARRTYPEPAVTLFGPDGQRVLNERDGVAVRVDAGNLLVFAKPLGGGEDDRSVAGVGAESGRLVELGQVKQVRGESCSWNTEVIACGSAKDFVLYRFAPAD